MKKIYNIAWMGCLVLLLAACEKDTEAIYFAPEVITGSVTNIYRKGATISGNILFSGSSSAEKYGILLSDLQSMVEYVEYPINSGETDYKVQVQGLQAGKTYYYCSYAYSGYSIARGEVNSFETTESNPPVFGDVIIDNIGWNQVRVTTTLLDDGGFSPIISGFCWREGNSGVPTLVDHVVNVQEISNNQLTAVVTGLTPDTEYVISAYSVNSRGMGFSQGFTFKTEEAESVSILGTWVTSLSKDMTMYLEFASNGRGISRTIEGELDDSYSFTWTMVDNQLIITFDDDGEVQTGTVVSVSETTMILETEEDGAMKILQYTKVAES